MQAALKTSPEQEVECQSSWRQDLQNYLARKSAFPLYISGSNTCFCNYRNHVFVLFWMHVLKNDSLWFPVEAFEEVSDSLCVPQYNKDGEERVILFLKMASNHAFSEDLVKRIRDAIRVALSARHVPSLILETKGIPVCHEKCCLLFFFVTLNSN